MSIRIPLVFDDDSEERPKPRKRPQQARSSVTVAAIIEAAAQVLERDGYDALTTTSVAERAGVSVGTLYQYFPDKAAVVAGLVEARLGAETQAMRAAYADAVQLSRDEATDRLVGAFVHLFEGDPAQSAAVLYGALRVRWRPVIDDLITSMIEATRDLLKPYLPDSSKAEQVAYTAVTAVIGVVARTLVEHPDRLRDGSTAHEVRTLVRAYLAAAEHNEV
ncbi:MAG: TetR/AcrR family transcriptional regulator [Bacteroidota bacterium]